MYLIASCWGNASTELMNPTTEIDRKDTMVNLKLLYNILEAIYSRQKDKGDDMLCQDD